MNWLLIYLLLFCSRNLANASIQCYHCAGSSKKSGVSLFEDSCAQFETSSALYTCSSGACYTFVTLSVSDPTFYEVIKGCMAVTSNSCDETAEKCMYVCFEDGCNARNPVQPETTIEFEDTATSTEFETTATSTEPLASVTLTTSPNATNSSLNSSSPLDTINSDQGSANGVGKAKTNVLDLFISGAASLIICQLSLNSSL